MRSRAVVPCLVLLALAALPSAAQNLVTNSSFTGSLVPWNSYPGEFTVNWDGTQGHTAAGSARVDVNTASAGLNSLVFWQCVPATAGASYDVSLWFFYPSSVANTPSGHVQLDWTSDAGCASSLFLSSLTPGISGPANTWNNAFGTLVAPAGTNGVRVQIALGTGAAGTSQMFIDDLLFGPTGTLPVTLQRFAAE